MDRNAEHVKRRRSGRGRRAWSMLFSLLMLFSAMLSAMPELSLKVQAEDEVGAYNDYLVTTDTNKDKSGEALTALQVYFNNMAWYVIEDDSLDAGTVTLLAADTIGASKFNQDGNNDNHYKDSKVKGYLDGLIAGTETFEISGEEKTFADVAAVIETIPVLTTEKYIGNDPYYSSDIHDTAQNVQLYLLSKREADALPENVRKCSQADGADSNCWWLRSPGYYDFAACVFGNDGRVGIYGTAVGTTLGVRPALKLNLSSVIFSSETATFTPWSYTSYLPKATDDDTALANKVVKFNGIDWYIIEDDSTAVNAGTVTLLAKECVTSSMYNESGSFVEYSNNPTVKTAVDNWYSANIAADAQTAVSGNAMFLLTKDQATTIYNVNPDVLKCPPASGTNSLGWWLCSQSYVGDRAAFVTGANGGINDIGEDVTRTLGVRPALKLNLSSVIFSSVNLSGGANAASSGGSAVQNYFDYGGTRRAMTTVTYTANEGCSFPETSSYYTTTNGITVTRTSDTEVTVSGTPTAANVNITIPDAIVDVSDVALTPSTATLTKGVDPVALTASINPDNATDKSVKWSVGGTSAGAVKLYTDAGCTTEVGTAATSALTVYAKGISTGNATVIVTSNSDSTKSATCAVTVEAFGGDPYAAMVNNSAATVKFNDLDWYIIEDNSTAVDAGTLTLFAKDPIVGIQFNENVETGNHYSNSKIKGYLDALTTGDGSFAGVADAIETVTVTTSAYNTEEYDKATDVKLYLLSTEEVNVLPGNIRKSSEASGMEYNCWWLRTPGNTGTKASIVDGDSGNIYDSTERDNFVDIPYGVRPALKLDLSSVKFSSSEGNAFTVLPAPTLTKEPKALSLTYNGNEQELVTAGQTADGTFYYALGENADTAPEFDGLSTDTDKKWSTAIPKASAVGSYYVWYMVKGDSEHRNSEAVCVEAEIKEYTAPPVNYYYVRFDMNGHGEAISPQRIRSGSKVQKPEDPVDDDYDFIGWYTDKECKQEYDFSKTVRQGFTLYAKWTKKDANAFTVSFDMQQHGEQIPAQSVPVEGKAEKPADPTAEGYSFGGWYTSPACKAEELYDFTTPVTADITLYAKWTEKAVPVFRSALDSVPAIEAETTELYLVKGQKFIIGKDWIVKKDDKASKDLVSISKKSGLLKAKKDGKATIWNGERSLTLHISAPSVPKKLELQITADGAGSKAIELTNPDELPVYWYSASPDVATVDQDGKVTAVSAGKSKVTAYINGCTYNCTVTVKEAVIAKERTLHILEGKTKNLSIKGVKKPVWSSADEDTASFTKKNKLTAKKAGDTILTATAADGTEYKVHLYVENITLSGDGLTPAKGKNKYNLTLKAGESTELSFANVEQDVVFKSSKPDSVFIDENGKVFARAKGKSKFTTKLNGKTITVNVVVE